ncbi:MAG: ERAP1-like C-terminal domain-containing protein, partial [Nitrosopumilaceae archaeon]
LTFYEDFKDEIRKYANNHLIKILQRLTWEPIDHEKNSHKLLRSYAIEFLGKMEDAEVVSEARKKFKQFLENPYSIVTDLLEPIFIVVAWNGGKNTHEELTSLYKQAKTQEEKDRFLKALSYFKDKNQILETLELSLSDAVRTQNIDIPINNIAKNPYGKKILWPWLKENWKKLTKKTGEGNYVIKRVIETVSEISDDSMIDEVKDFLKKNPTNGTEKTLSQALERAQINSKFLKRMRNEFS